MTSRCERLARATHYDCEELRRECQRAFGASLKSERCERCGMWHLRFASDLTLFEMRILRDFALGFRTQEVLANCGIVELRVNTVNRRVFELFRKTACLSREHLIAVAIQIGVISLLFEGELHAVRSPGGHPLSQDPLRTRGTGSAEVAELA